MSSEMRLRNHAVRAVVATIDDGGDEQRAVVQTHAGVTRSVIVHQPFGLAAHPPADGAISVMIGLGGDEADPVVLGLSNPQAARMGGLAEGESALYDAAGQRVHLVGGQTIAIGAVQQVQVSIGAAVVLVVKAGGVQITGDLTVSGKITATGDVVAGSVSVQQHLHGGVQSGAAKTSMPV